MLGRTVIFSAWSFAMINLQSIVFWGCGAGVAPRLMLSVLYLQSRHGSVVARIWLGVTFYGAPLPPVRLLWTSWFLHICGHDFQNRVSANNHIGPLSKTLDTPILAQIVGVYDVPPGFDLLSVLLTAELPAAWSQIRAANITRLLAALQVALHNLDGKLCFQNTFPFLLWFKQAVPNIWITLCAIIQSARKARANKNFEVIFFKNYFSHLVFFLSESCILLLVQFRFRNYHNTTY